jgi:hypothetical protein
LWDETTPPSITAHVARPDSTGLDVQAHEAVVDQHLVARLQHLADHRRADRQLAVQGRLGGGHDHLLATPERDGLLEVADPQLRALKVGDERDRLPELGLGRRGRAAPTRGVARASRARG